MCFQFYYPAEISYIFIESTFWFTSLNIHIITSLISLSASFNTWVILS